MIFKVKLQFSRTPEKLFSFCSTSAQAKVWESECVFSSGGTNLLCSLSPHEFDPANSFAQHRTLLIRSENFMSFRCSPSIFAMETNAKYSDTLRLSLHLLGTLLLVPYSSGCPMFLGSPQPSQENHGKQSVPRYCSAVSCCIHLMFLLLLFFFCSGRTSDFRHCESIITARVANTNTKKVIRQKWTKPKKRVFNRRIWRGWPAN